MSDNYGKINLKGRIKLLFFNLLWRLILIFYELIRLVFTVLTYPIMLINYNAFVKIYPFFNIELKNNNKKNNK